FGQIDNLYRFSHVKNKDLTAISHISCFNYQLTSLRNGHEIPGDIRMGHRYWSTFVYLVLESWNHCTVRSQNISKTCRDKPSPFNAIYRGQELVQGLDIFFSNPFGGTHHIRW